MLGGYHMRQAAPDAHLRLTAVALSDAGETHLAASHEAASRVGSY